MRIEKGAKGTPLLHRVGGLKILEDQMQDGALKKRGRGTRANAQSVSAVINLKKQGKTQAEAARELGLSTSTVQRYWQKD